MKKPDIVLNSIPRSANTFLAFSFRKAIDLNIEGGTRTFYEDRSIHSHLHYSFFLRVSRHMANIEQFTNFRHPIEQIPSLLALPNLRAGWIDPNRDTANTLEERLFLAIKQQDNWLSTYLESQNAHILLFDDIKNNINDVLQYMFNVLDLDFNKEIDEQEIKDELGRYEDSLFLDRKERFNMGRIPRGFNETEEYVMVQDILNSGKWEYAENFNKILLKYAQVLRIKEDQSSL